MKRWMVLLLGLVLILLVGCGQFDVQGAMVTVPEATRTQVEAEMGALVLKTATPPPASEASGETATPTETTTIEPSRRAFRLMVGSPTPEPTSHFKLQRLGCLASTHQAMGLFLRIGV
jgi:hypothetical protein